MAWGRPGAKPLYLNQNWYVFIQENAFENVVWKIAAILSRPQCVNNIFKNLDAPTGNLTSICLFLYGIYHIHISICKIIGSIRYLRIFAPEWKYYPSLYSNHPGPLVSQGIDLLTSSGQTRTRPENTGQQCPISLEMDS